MYLPLQQLSVITCKGFAQRILRAAARGSPWEAALISGTRTGGCLDLRSFLACPSFFSAFSFFALAFFGLFGLPGSCDAGCCPCGVPFGRPPGAPPVLLGALVPAVQPQDVHSRLCACVDQPNRRARACASTAK